MLKTKTNSRKAKPVSSIWHFRASEFIRDTGPRNLWLVFGFLILGMTITALASLYLKSEAERAAEREFDFISSEIQLNIADRLAASAQVLYSGAALFDSSESVTREGWRTFISQLRIEEQLPGTQGVGFALLIPPDQLEQHIQQIRDEGFLEYAVRPEGDRETYSSIIYLEPFSGRNLRAFGYDMFSEPVRRAAMEQARDENSAVLSGKVVLVQETNEDVQAGTLMYVPIYRKGLPIETVEQRRAAIIGWVYSPYRMTDLMRGTLRNWEAQQGSEHYHLQVYDGDVISADTLLFDSRSEADIALAASTPEFSRLTPVDFEGHHWTLRFSQMGGLSTLADYDSFWFMLSGGTSFTIILAGLALSVLRTQVNAQRIAKELTIELKESEEKYSIIFNNEVYAICIFNLETLELLDVNKAYEHVYGYSREELLSGMTIHDITAEHQASSEATVKAVNEGTTFIPLRYHRKKDGTVFPVEIVGGPYVWRNRKVMFTLAHDITDRKQDEQELRKLGRAIEQSPASVVITDTDGNIEYVNPKFTEITGYTLAEVAGNNPRLLKSGFTTEQEYRNLWDAITSGIQWQGEFQNRRKSGELYWEKATIAPVWNDNGQITNFLAIKEDITQRKQVEEALHQSENRYRSLAENTQDVIGRFDRTYHHLFANQAAAKVSGIPAKTFIGKTHRELGFPVEQCIVWEKAIEQVFTKHKPVHEYFDFAGPAGIINFDWWLYPEFDSEGNVVSVLSNVHDITERKQAEELVRASEQKHRRLFESMTQGVVYYDAEARIISANPAAERILGFNADQLQGKTYQNPGWKIYNEDETSIGAEEHPVSIAFRTGRKVDGFTIKMLNPRKQETLWLSVTAIPLFRDGEERPYQVYSTFEDITSRKLAEEELRTAHLFLNSVIEQSPASLWISDEHGTLIRMNQACRDVLHVRDEEVVGKYNILNDNQIKAQGYMPQVRDVFEKGETARFLMTYNTAEINDLSLKQTARVVLDVNISAIRNSHGKVTNAIIQHINITQLDSMEKELRQSEERYRLLATTIPEPIFMHQEGRVTFVNNAALKLFGAVKAEDLIGTPIMDRVHPEYRQIVKERVGGSADKPEALATIEEIFLRLDGSPVNVEVAANRLIMNGKATMQVVAHDVTQRKMMETALRASEQKYRLLFDTMNEGIALNEIVYDENGEMIDYRIIEVNEAFYTTADYQGSVIGALATKLYGMSLETIQAFWHEHKDRKTVQLTEFSSPLKGRHFIVSTSPFIHDRFVTSFFDITERKTSEEKVNELNRDFVAFLENTTDFIYFKDSNSRIRFCSQPLADITGHASWRDMIGKHDLEIFPQDVAEIYYEEEFPIFSEGLPLLNKVDPYYDASGKLGWVNTNKWPLLDMEGRVAGVFGISRDVTERKKLEDALLDSELKLIKAQEAMHLGNWELNLITNTLTWSDEIYRLFEIDRTRFAPSYEGFLNAIHPDDRALVNDKYQYSLKTREPYHVDHRLLMPDGRVKWVHEACDTDFDAQGIPLISRGTIQDITERKQMEIDLQAQRDFATQIVNVMGQGLTVTDADGRFEFVNPAYAQLFGYVPADLIGRRPSDISLPEEEAVLSEQRKQRKKGQVSTYESRLIRTDGSIAHVLITGAPREIDGKYAGAIAVITDLTEQKQAENRLRESEEKYRTVANFTYAWEAWRAPDGTYLYNSPSCEQISGHSAAEFNTNPDLMLEITHPDDQPILIEHQRAAGGELKDQDLEIDFRIITPGGETRWIAHSCTTVYSEDKHWLGRRESNLDITDRKLKEELLFESENRYRRLFETAKDGILIVDAESGLIKDVNPFLIELLGYSRDQFIDKELWELGFFRDIVANQDNFLELQQKQYIRYENLPLETFDGRKVNVEFISNVYLVDNQKVIQCNIRDITARRKAEEKIRLLNAELEALAGTDGLTGINNHRSLLKLSEREFEVAMRYQPPLSMMFFDIDHFKQINDTFGHAIGDEALKLTVETVCAKLRSADLIGRYGGDEFVILLPQTSALDALPLAERIHAGIADMRLDTNKGPLTLTISIGIAQSIHGTSEHDTVESLLLRADQALYAAKQAGRNRTVIFDDRLS